MRLPGTRYQEHGWEHVRKLLGLCSLPALRRLPPAQLADPEQHHGLLDDYTSAVTAALRAQAHTARGQAAGNSYGESVHELALGLVFELQAYPSAWQAFMSVLAAEQARGGAHWDDPAADGALRKKVNDMYAGLRDRVDADHYTAATGRDCSPNKICTYRMLDTAWREIARLFEAWHDHREQVAEILGRAMHANTSPIEARQAASIRDCKAEWIIRWSAGLEAHGGAPGPLHTRSKRFASLKNNPARIAAMLAEIADYEELSSNRDSAEPWQGDAGAAALWLDDYWRVIAESIDDEAQGGEPRPDFLLPPPAADDDEDGDHDDEQADDDADPVNEATPDTAQLLAEQQAAGALSLPLRYMELARAAQAAGSRTVRILHEESLAIRLAVYHKLLGAADDSYPDAWLDPATGELPTLQQLAALDGISMPTLRKRRNLAIDKLHAASAVAAP